MSAVFTDEQLGELVDALESFEVSQIQGFLYPPKHVIRDCLRKPGAQVIWEGPDDDDATFHRQCEIERMRVAIALWLTKPAMQAPGLNGAFSTRAEAVRVAQITARAVTEAETERSE